ncbi:MAG TPA: HNH endonuclease signature motif containing protein [Candidatus Paceibacterota bacterium]
MGYKWARITKVCPQCGSAFKTSPSHNKVCCSVVCSAANRSKPLADRFWDKVDKSGSCWLWIGAVNEHGYGKVSAGGRKGKYKRAHVAAYEMEYGPVPEGLELDHLCHNRRCVRPDHLEAVTRQVNVNRGDNAKGKMVGHLCKYGHALTPDNLYISNGRRACKTCSARRSKAYKDRVRSKHSGRQDTYQDKILP